MRRIKSLLAFAVALVIGVTGFAVTPASAATPEDDVQTINSRLQEYYLGQGDEIIIANGIYLARTSEALEYVESQQPDGSWADVDYTDRTSSANGRTWSAYIALYRMLALAQAYRDPAAPGFERPEVLASVEQALRHWDVADPGNTNWWETEIGESIAMGRISIFLGDVLSQDALDISLKHNTGKLDPVGANGSWRTHNFLMEAVSTGDLTAIEAGFATMVQTVQVDHSGEVREAVQPDASFWAHGAQLYSEGYGMVLFTYTALWADVARGTGLAFSRDQLDAIAFYIISGTRWMIRGEIGMLYLNYRAPKTISGVTSHASEFIEPLQRMVRTDALYSTSYQALLDSVMGETRTNGVTGNKYFWRSEFAAHLREDYGIFTRLNSSRTRGSEYRSTFRPEIGNEIVWNSASATAIQVNNREYLDLGPTFDWFHYPGVTAPYVKEQTRGTTGNGGSFTGGVSDGTYGATVYSLDRAATKAKKSTFSFDDEMVALGAGIESTSDAAVHTTVNQAVAKANASVDGEPVSVGTASSAIDDAGWAYNDEVGYVFPADGALKVSNADQTGSWLGEDPVTRQAFTLYYDHGVRPADAGYEYIVLPGAEPGEVEAYAADPAVEVLRNDTSVQAVRHPELRRTMATFYQAGALDLGGGRVLEVSQPSLVILDESGEAPVASVANPSQPGAVVHVSLTGADTSARATFGLGVGANLGKTVTAQLVPFESGEHAAYQASDAQDGHGAALAGDGDHGTDWRSAGDGTSWLQKEIGAGAFLTGVTIAWGDEPASRYLLQTSRDGVTWTDQRFTQDGTGGEVRLDVAPVAATYVRLLMVESANGNGYAVQEFEVDASVNVALGRAVSASGGTSAGSVTDGAMDTRWSANNSDSAWVQIDLGSVQPLRTVRLWWEASFARQYAIQVSDDGSSWRDAYRTSGAGSDGGSDIVSVDEEARYVRMQAVQRSTTQYGVSLWEFEVFADDGIANAPTTPAGRENLALGRPIVADSTYNPTASAANANDGNLTTRWSSNRQNAPYTTERWLQVDLEGVRTINQAVVTWEAATSNDYRIEGSLDGETWQELARVQKTSAELKNVVDFAGAEVQYVRVIGLPVTQYGVSIFEFEVYGGYNLGCVASPVTAERNSSAVLAASIQPLDADDTFAAFPLDASVVSVTGDPRVGDDGRIEFDVATGDAGTTPVLVTHGNGDEFAWCQLTLAVDTAELVELVERADTLDSRHYTPASWAPLLPALEAAKAVLQAADASQSMIDERATALAAALDGLVVIEPEPEITAPSAPRDVAASASGGTVHVVWSAPETDGGAPLTGYEVTVGESVLSVDSATLSVDVPGLAPGTYTVTVRAENEVGWSEPSAGVEVEVVDGTPVLPTVSVDGVLKAGGEITVSGRGFTAETEYDVELRSTPQALGAAITDAQGAFSLDATIAADTVAGEHTVVVMLDGTDVASARVQISPADVDPGPGPGPGPGDGPGDGSGPGGGSSGDRDGDLARTGIDVAGLSWAAGGAVLLLLVGAAVMILRRRRAEG
ncbi:polysaccharide lyase family 8 super-sandwich domain-containing protein [Agromyces silvae]|uniref:polysaccharide lyase family 8 super-sandwich domain-containing protein n=1 Tax=Agromyces silvae TaxID=3388266 RepID=UPI00280B267E|nr:polysaccharide lyase family 8 super-sandwich domain-containing protein [Agromyces protaetiae]